MKIYKVEINGRTFDIIQDTDGKFIRPEVNGGSALKPANEPICLARKPLSEKTIVDNVIKWGTGGINVDGCRIETDDNLGGGAYTSKDNMGTANYALKDGRKTLPKNNLGDFIQPEGRFPANILFDEEAAQVLDEQSGKLSNQSTSKRKGGFKTEYVGGDNIKKYETDAYNDKGGASRFFYIAKVSKKERNLGLDNFEDKIIEGRDEGQDTRSVAFKKRPTPMKNTHPTLKPINLMTYLCRLITPPGGIILDPFMGSGSTGISACLEGFRFVGMELDEDYFKIAEARVNNFEEYRKLLKK
jgi:site-specific DNA-methyltransferase (adenine-specific)